MPFDLAEFVVNQESQEKKGADSVLRSTAQKEVKQNFSQIYSDYESTVKGDIPQQFSGKPIDAIVEQGSAALKLNVHELSGDEEQYDP